MKNKVKVKKIYDWWTSGGSEPSPDQILAQHMDAFNFQSDPENFTLVSNAVSQWNDLSANARHLKQTTAANRPLYNGGEILFDGINDNLVMDAQVSLSVFSYYAVVKSSDLGTKHFESGTSSGQIGKNTGRTIRTTGVSENIGYKLYGDEYYQIISLRKNGTTHKFEINDRRGIRTLGTPVASVYNFRYLGTRSLGDFWNGIVRARCCSTQEVDDTAHETILNALFTKYNLPEVSNALVGFGDSITEGTGASNQFTTAWLPALGTLRSRPIKNFGIGSSRLTAVNADSGVTRFSDQVIERPYSDTLCILYGTNDISASIPVATYEAALNTVISQAIAAGYNANKICIGTVPYRQGDAFAAQIALYNTSIANVSTTYGLLTPADVYNTMKAVGDSCLADTVHPNDTGHAIIRDAFAARIAA